MTSHEREQYRIVSTIHQHVVYQKDTLLSLRNKLFDELKTIENLDENHVYVSQYSQLGKNIEYVLVEFIKQLEMRMHEAEQYMKQKQNCQRCDKETTHLYNTPTTTKKLCNMCFNDFYTERKEFLA